MNELDQILRQDALQQSSATRIQSAVRNRRATNETIKRATRKKELNDAATTIQSAVRNRNALNETISRATRKNELNNAASTIQKVLRGHKSRKEIPGIIEEHNLQQIIKKVDDVEQKANQMNNAAVTIQGAIKGHKARKALRDQQPKFKADYTDEEFKTKEIKN